MGRTDTKKMVQGAMLAAIFGVLSLLNTYTGSMFDIFICYVMVIPLVWYGYTYTLKDNIIVCIVSMFVIAMVGLPFFVISSISSCLAGLFIGEALRRHAKRETILFGTFVATFLNNILLYEVFAGLLDMNLMSEMTETYQMMVEFVPSITNTISLEAFLSFVPMILIVMSAMEMYVIVMLCQVVLHRLKVEFPGSFHIAAMHLSKKTGILLAIGMFGSYAVIHFTNFYHIYFTYIQSLCTMVFALEGLAFFAWLLIVLKKPLFMLLVFIGLLIPFVNTLYVVVGIIDIFSDLRENILYNRRSND
ncbi:MAG: DUF2232 domain-containing protein [Longibaculum sp.]